MYDFNLDVKKFTLQQNICFLCLKELFPLRVCQHRIDSNTPQARKNPINGAKRGMGSRKSVWWSVVIRKWCCGEVRHAPSSKPIPQHNYLNWPTETEREPSNGAPSSRLSIVDTNPPYTSQYSNQTHSKHKKIPFWNDIGHGNLNISYNAATYFIMSSPLDLFL